MRLLVTALVVATWVGGCTAVTDFNQFHIGSTADLAVVDLAYKPAAFGEPCDPGQVTPCEAVSGTGSKPLMCLTSLDGHPVSGSICTRDCTAIMPCAEFGGAVCAMVGSAAQPNYCVPGCNLPSVQCRSGLTCCMAGTKVTSGPGACVPGC